jgi:hypothetical protein
MNHFRREKKQRNDLSDFQKLPELAKGWGIAH